MKTRCLSDTVITKRTFSHFFSIAALGLVYLSVSTSIENPALADSQLDRTYALETIGYLNAWDNMDGIFSQYVSEAIEEYFSEHNRFSLQDVSRANEILGRSKLDYKKIIEDREILAQLARSTRSQTLLRTRITKEGPYYKFHIEWLHAPRLDKLAEERFSLEKIDDIKALMKDALGRIVEKVPFKATLTGRDHDNVTVNVGAKQGISPGDEMVIATLEDVKRHPLLNTIVDWKMRETGRIRIEEVEPGISFGKITSEEPGYEIARYQKVQKIFTQPTGGQLSPVQIITDEVERYAKYRIPPRLGWMSAGGWLGTFSREVTQATDDGRKGSGILLGTKAEGQLWLTRNIFTEGGLGYAFAPYSQKNSISGEASTGVDGSISVSMFRLAMGYTYFATPDFFGPKGWVKFGLRTYSYSMGVLAAELASPSSFKSFYVGIGGELPIRQRYGALLNLDFGVLNSSSASALGSLGSINGSTDVNFHVGGYYRHTPRMTFRLGVDVTSHGAEFTSGNLTQRTIALMPSVLFYF